MSTHNLIYVLSRSKKISEILSENFQFLVVKYSVYLNRGVFLIFYFYEVVSLKYLVEWQLE